MGTSWVNQSVSQVSVFNEVDTAKLDVWKQSNHDAFASICARAKTLMEKDNDGMVGAGTTPANLMCCNALDYVLHSIFSGNPNQAAILPISEQVINRIQANGYPIDVSQWNGLAKEVHDVFTKVCEQSDSIDDLNVRAQYILDCQQDFHNTANEVIKMPNTNIQKDVLRFKIPTIL